MVKKNTSTKYETELDYNNVPKYSSLASLKKHIEICVDADIPCITYGSFGVGKTALVKDLDPNKYVVHVEDLCTIDVPDINGILVPNLNENTSYFTEPKIITKCNELAALNPGKIVVLFLDDLTNADPSLHAGLFRLMQFKSIGDYHLPENTRILCAGNDSDSSSVANDMPEPLLNRLSVCKYAGPTANEWTSYAVSKGFEPEIVAMIKKNPNYLLGHTIGGSDMSQSLQSPTPRSWEMCSNAISSAKRINPNTTTTELQNLIGSFVGAQMATQVVHLIELYPQVYSFDSIVDNPTNLSIDESVMDTVYYLQTEIIVHGLVGYLHRNGTNLLQRSKTDPNVYKEASDSLLACIKFLTTNKVPQEFINFLFVDIKKISKSHLLSILTLQPKAFKPYLSKSKVLSELLRDSSQNG